VNVNVTSEPVTAARMMGAKPAMVYSIITTSMAKITAASGVLNEAAIPAAAPQPTSVRTLLLGKASWPPSQLPVVAPICAAAPSRPIDWPLAMASADIVNSAIAALTGSTPW